ncbi:MAG: PEGA domain-containing protein [Deltaproteobacteria bacterium]|nr:PEGA domain-containing protein [Deltaproteobacteria bacterium]
MIATEAAAPTQPKAEAEAAPVEATPVEAADTGVVNFRVLSRPSGAFVSVNGKGIGRTPLELEYEVGLAGIKLPSEPTKRRSTSGSRRFPSSSRLSPARRARGPVQ